MIICDKRGNDILNAGETRIAFAVNTEGMNALGFSGMISHQYWPELANIGNCKLGTVMTKRCPNGITFYALVCYSWKFGWFNTSKIIQECFDAIEGDEPIASIAFGTKVDERLSGAQFQLVKKGMQLSKKEIILY